MCPRGVLRPQISEIGCAVAFMRSEIRTHVDAQYATFLGSPKFSDSREFNFILQFAPRWVLLDIEQRACGTNILP